MSLPKFLNPVVLQRFAGLFVQKTDSDCFSCLMSPDDIFDFFTEGSGLRSNGNHRRLVFSAVAVSFPAG